MTDQELENYIDAAASQQGLIIDPAWREAVMAYYRLSMQMAVVLSEHPLPFEAEPAPVFSA